MAKVPQKKNSNFLRSLFKQNNIKTENTSPIENDILLDYYQSLANYHPDLIVVLSLDGKIISQNRKSLNEFLGYHSREKINYSDFINQDSYSTVQSAFYATLKGKPQRHEVIIRNKHGELLNTVLTFIPIRKTNGDVEGIYIIIRDNTKHKRLQNELALKERHLTHAQQIANIGSWEYDITGDKLFCSDYFYDIFGFDKSKTIPTMDKPFAFVHPEDNVKVRKIVDESCRKGISYAVDFRIYHGKTNKLKYIKVQAEVIWKNNNPYKLVGVIKDYTTQKHLESQMIETQKSYRHIFDNLNVGIWLRDYDSGNVTYISKRMEDILQYPLQMFYNRNSANVWQNIVHPDDRKEALERQKLLQNGETLLHKYRIICGDGTTKWIFDQTVPWFDENGKLIKVFGMFADITPEVEMQQQLDYFATHDTLTGLPNQRSLYEKLDHLCAERTNKKFALFYLDLDRFQMINDSLGYQIGDEVLNQIASRLLSILPNNSYVARISSNDFVALIEDYNTKDGLFQLAEFLIKKMMEPLTVNGYGLHITTSIGISFFPDDGETKLSLIENAHAALYHAKNLGKNNYQLYSFSRDISSYKKYVIEKDMRRAIENEEFEVYYQPRVDAKSGVIQGAEALIRWNHEEWGLVSPGEFIPLAEENHLVHHIGEFVLKQVCSQLRTWKDNGVKLHPISINISPLSFMRPGLVAFIEEQLTTYDVPAKYLEIEITESSLLRSELQVLETLQGLKDLGIKIAIDDFGTGYASLNYLRQFHADTLKIDKLFVEKIAADNKSNAAIISSVLHLAKGLEMKVVAEGVEDYEQLEFLQQKECKEVQGFLFSKPVPIDTFEQMLQTGYIKPTKQKVTKQPEEERRSFYRFAFPRHVLGEMSITEVNKRKVNLGSADVLVKDIGLGGIKILSSLNLPVNSPMKLKFSIRLLGENFDFDGTLVWKNEAKGDTFHYGINFDIHESNEDRLAVVINKMTVLQRLNQEIPDTNFINENPYLYLRKNHI
ncbi:EAL domain-containing protein [Virgibacillus sp. FSP13]